MSDVPVGFQPLETESPFNTLVGPYYVKQTSAGLRIGLLIEAKHCNRGGRLHGAMTSALFDVAIGHNVGLSLTSERHGSARFDGAGAPIATVSLNTDYVGSAQAGDWVEVDATVLRTGRSLAFASALLNKHSNTGEVQSIARANAVFKILGQ